MTIRDDIRKMVTVADYFYCQGLSKSEISKILGISRQSVTNLLENALRRGMVEIRISDPYQWNLRLSDELISLTGLRDVIAVPISQNLSDHIKENIGLAGSSYLTRLIKPNQIIGIGWGKTLLETVSNIEWKDHSNAIVVPIMGGLGKVSYELQVNRLANHLASNIHGQARQLFAPGIVESKFAADSLLNTEAVSEITHFWNHLDLALIGVGGLQNISAEDLTPNGYMSFEEVNNLHKIGVVGDVCMRFYDSEGNNVKVTDNWFPISITLEQLKKVPTVICLAGGKEKVDAIQGAINGGFVDILISDEVVVKELVHRFRAHKV